MAQSSPEGIELGKGSQLVSMELSINKEKVISIKQEERNYSEEDMAESFMACWKANVPEGFQCNLSFNEWFNEFKKK